MKNNDSDKSGSIISIGHIDLTEMRLTANHDDKDLPIIPTRNLVMFPGVIIPINLVRENSLATARIAKEKGYTVGIVCQINSDDDHPTIDTLHRYGVYGEVVQLMEMPDETHMAVVKASGKFKILGNGLGEMIPISEISASVKPIKEVIPKDSDKEFVAICDIVKEMAERLMKQPPLQNTGLEMMLNMISSDMSKTDFINTIATHIPADNIDKMAMLSCFRMKDRASMLLMEMGKQNEKFKLVEEMHERARQSFDDQQRRMFLQRQMEAIGEELNGDENDALKLREKAESLPLPEKVAAYVAKEITKLERYNPSTPDYSVQYTYIETLLDLPWGKYTEKATDIVAAREHLDKEHYGLTKIKERILEQIAVMLNNDNSRSPIICLVGPPGVGKTSLGHSIAETLNRKFARVSLGGVHDEAEIRGHRRTYIGAMPGRIIDAVRRSESSNPVIMLDEIDKLGNDYKGDPSSALLEVLDPEQNCRFHDNYIDLDFDLSKAMFIATANTLTTLPQPLIDRMEVIEMTGYLPEEKIEIARRHIIPRMLKELSINAEDFKISDASLNAIIDGYTSESGVRALEKQLNSLARKTLLRRMLKENVAEVIEPEHVAELLGAPRYSRDRYENNSQAGVATGLAWTAVGGEILFIETSLSPGNGEKLTLTGQLGDVMKESAMIALEYLRAHAAERGIDADDFKKWNFHIHVPEGAIPKDGPSAGITMTASIASALTGRMIRNKTAMTGEITLRGKVLPVGGIKEKILAAKRAGITDIVLPEGNRKDVEEIEMPYRAGLEFKYISTIAEGLEFLLI